MKFQEVPKAIKQYSICALVALMPVFAQTASAAPSGPVRDHDIGNGGGVWACQNGDSLGTLRWARLVDLYEGRTEFNLDIPEVKSRDYLEIVDNIMVRRLFPVNESLYRAVNDQLEAVKTSLVMVDADLEIVDDALFRIRPSKKECVGGSISYVQLANFTNYGKILVQKNVFEDPRFSETDRAALLMHEAIYAYLREWMGDNDSGRARKIVGLLFSTIAQDALQKEIDKTLGGGLNAVGMEFVKVRPGSFMMGSPEGEAGRYGDEKLHPVQLTNSYDIQTTHVTQKQYFDVMGVNPSQFKNRGNCPKTFMVVRGTTLCPNHPVEQVSYDDVQVFIAKMNANRNNGYFYRLPTEAEWEFAARAGTSTAYSFGDDPSQLALYGWILGNSGGQTHEVAQLRPNGLGLYDMHGNVWQWVSDWYGEHSSTGQINPTGASSGSLRVGRGGSCCFWNEHLRSALRFRFDPAERNSNLGFRLVRIK